MVIQNLDDEQLEDAVASCLTEEQLANLYLQTLWPSHDEAGLQSVLYSKDGTERQKWFPQMDLQSLLRFLMKQSAEGDTRLSWSSYNWRKRTAGRALEMPGLFVDIDLAGSHHEKQNLPTMTEAKQAVDNMPLPVSIMLHTGGGLLAVWLFDTAFKVTGQRPRAEQLLQCWENQLRSILGKHVDRAAKLTAVPRVPGTQNHKSGTLVRILRPELVTNSYSDGLDIIRKVPRYTVEQFEDVVEDTSGSLFGEDDFEARDYSQQDKTDAFAAVQLLTSEQADDRDAWVKAGLCLKEIGSSFSSDEDCFQAWCAFGRKSGRFSDTEDAEYQQAWDSFDVTNGGNAVGILVGMSQEQESGEIRLTGVVKLSAVPEENEEDEDLLTFPSDDTWPAALGPAAMLGPVGDFVNIIGPHTEADPAALVFQMLVTVGNILNRQVWFTAEADRHCANLFAVLVGKSSKGRKGTSHGQVSRLVDLMAVEDGSDLGDSLQHWMQNCQTDGLSTGAGLVYHVRDEVVRWDVKNQCQQISDPGISDKRLLVCEGEFAQILKVMKREGNDLSPVLRKAWDRGELRSLVKNDPTRATGAHISIVGHITSIELRGHLTATEIGNGFGNRFLWICVQRSKMLPSSPDFDSSILRPVYERLRQTVRFADFGETGRTAAAEKLWHSVYPTLSRERYGVAGSLLSRAEAQVMRMAMIYSLMDLSNCIEERHLLAALECWRYVEDSVRYVFGQKIGDETADSIHDALRTVSDGMTRTDLSSFFSRHKTKAEIDHGLRILLEAGLIKQHREQKKTGRPALRFCIV